MKFYHVLIIILFLIPGILYSQEKRLPKTFIQENEKLFDTSKIKFNDVYPENKKKIIERNRQKPDNPDSYGFVFMLNKSFKREAVGVELANGDSLWVLKFKAKGACGMEFIFDTFDIPERATLFIYNKNKSMFIGPYVSSDTNHKGRLITDYIRGEEIIIEYFEPKDATFSGNLFIKDYTYVFFDIFKSNSSDSNNTCDLNIHTSTSDEPPLECHVNVQCFPE